MFKVVLAYAVIFPAVRAVRYMILVVLAHTVFFQVVLVVTFMFLVVLVGTVMFLVGLEFRVMFLVVLAVANGSMWCWWSSHVAIGAGGHSHIPSHAGVVLVVTVMLQVVLWSQSCS